MAGPSAAVSVTMKRSMSEGVSTTSGTSSRPTEVAKVPNLAAANNSALVRAALRGSAFVTALRAKVTTSPAIERGA